MELDLLPRNVFSLCVKKSGIADDLVQPLDGGCMQSQGLDETPTVFSMESGLAELSQLRILGLCLAQCGCIE